ncbi:hypothetical protein GCM10020367_58900 [Streptomyces sannanensis]|uniref:Uncharacterized protein n=1 Tax=Streptomyces sannanensis TaxID=285536 RepID=A0ABP6SKE1_9ACTN
MALQQPWDLLAEGLPPAAQDRADQAPHPDADHDPAAVHRHIRHHPAVIPVHLSRRYPAHRAGHRNIPGPGRDPDHLAAIRHILNGQRR